MDSSWSTSNVDLQKLLLDYQNPRIDATESSTQEDIIKQLVDYENIIELAKGIVDSSGLLAGERIIITTIDHKYIVLEGNRRVCACKLLVDRNLIPQKSKKQFYISADDELKRKLKKVQVDIAPDRASAEPIITKRHTEPGVEQWTPQAKQRRIARLINDGKTLQEVADEFQMTKYSVVKLLKEYNLIRHVLLSKEITKTELSKLKDPKLKPNSFTRFFSLKGVTKYIGLSFTEKGDLVFSSNDTNLVIIALAKAFLLRTTVFNTRSTVYEVLEYIGLSDDRIKKCLVRNGFIFKESEEKLPVKKPSRDIKSKDYSGDSSNPGASTKPEKFFETLTCTISDPKLVQAVKEISSINYRSYPLSATFLFRALLERSLIYSIKETKQLGPMMKDYTAEHGQKNRKDPGLEFVIDYCITHNNDIFNSNRAKDVLNYCKSIKDISDMIIHGIWVNANYLILEHAATITRDLFNNIFNGTILNWSNV